MKFHYIILALFLSTYVSYGQDWLVQKRIVEKQKVYASHNCVTLADSTNVTVQPNGSGSFSIYKTILIQNREGALKNRVIIYDYDPLTAFASFSYATIYRANGDIINLDVTQAKDYVAPARAIYWGARQIMLEVGRLYPGDVVEYKIEKKGFTYALLTSMDENDERFIPPMRGHFYDIVPFWNDEPTVKKVYRVSMPAEKDMQFEFYQGENIMPFPKEPNMVDLFDVAPKLMMSSTPKWEDKSLWFNKTNEDYGSFEALPEAQKKVDEIIKGKKTEMDKIAALTHWVADNIRYSGISMGKGEGYTLHNTKMNHCVAVVKLSNGTYMPLDPTWVPFLRELWSSAEQQQNYLPGVPEGSDLKITPVSPPENHYFRINSQTSLLTDGTLKGKFTVMAEGQSDGVVRRIFTRGFQSEWYNALERELLNVSPQAKLVNVDYGKDPRDYQSGPIKITYTFEIPNYALMGEDVIVFKPLTMNNLYNSVKTFLRINTEISERSYAFKDACSRLVELDEQIKIPKGYRLIPIKNMQSTQTSPVADFNGSISFENNQIKIQQKLALKKRVYEAGDWDSFRKAVNEHKSFGESLIIKKL